MRIQTTVQPTVEPVTVALAKQHARVDIDTDDDLIAHYIHAAREYCEKYTNRYLITQTVAIYFDDKDIDYAADFLALPVRPIQSITSYTTYAEDNSATVVPTADYTFLDGGLEFASTYDWPTSVRFKDTFKVIAVVGYGSSGAAVPSQINQAILMLVAHYYQNREAIYDSVNGSFNNNVPNSVTACLAAYKEYII